MDSHSFFVYFFELMSSPIFPPIRFIIALEITKNMLFFLLVSAKHV